MLEAKTVANGAAARPKLVKAEGKEPKPLSKLVVNGVIAITPELAQRIVLECGYDKQRGVRPLVVTAMAGQMRRKEWTQGTQLHFARMTADGWLRLVNGQHRLHAVVEANTTVQFQMLVTDCKTEDEVDRLYRRHDRLAVHRTIEDMMRAEGIPAKYGMGTYFARGVFNAALIIAADFAFSHRAAKTDPYLYRSDEARLRLCEPWWDIAQDYHGAISAGDQRIKKNLSSGPVMAVGLVTLRDQDTKADAFWRGLANNDGLKKGDPRHAYHSFLNLGKGKLGGFRAAKAASIAWNAFYADRELDFVRMTESAIHISGCNVG